MLAIEMIKDAANTSAHNKPEERQEESWRTPYITRY